MKLLRLIAILLGAALIFGEAYRSWGADRPVPFWIDDMIIGVMLIASAIVVSKNTFSRRAFFTAAWAVSAGMLYPSFFGKLYAPETINAGNFELGALTFLVGLALVISVIGMVASIILPRPS